MVTDSGFTATLSFMDNLRCMCFTQEAFLLVGIMAMAKSEQVITNGEKEIGIPYVARSATKQQQQVSVATPEI